MAQATFHFPRGFLWGTSTSAHQVEGNNLHNNWWAWEQQPGRIADGHRSGLACDWWGGRWREDFDRAAEAGQNAHRLSLEWSRIQPDPQRWDEDALDRYREMLRGLHERGVAPLVTLHHFTEPLWLSEAGGWENDAYPEYFEAYVRRVVEALREYASLWVTINEPAFLAVKSYLLGEFPPGRKSLKATFTAMRNIARAHGRAYHAIHQLQPTARVGMAFLYHSVRPARPWFPLDRLMTGVFDQVLNRSLADCLADGILRLPLGRQRIPEARKTQDFVGLDYYSRELVAFDLRKPGQLFAHHYLRPDAQHSETGYLANEPDGMFEALRWGRKYGLPLIVTENGVDDSRDVLRPQYLLQHVHQVWRAVNLNWPVKGYFHWSLVDNFEWERGWTQRFGLWELEVETQTRRKRASADLYAEICRENGISSEAVARYAPQVLEQLFP